jgi:hypothetical protein
MTTIKQKQFQGLECHTMENSEVSLSLLPEVGGKMISLMSKRTGFEFLSLSGRPFRKPAYGEDFEALDISGFDECFPAIGKGIYPERPWEGIEIPDHGELFTLPWDCEIVDDRIIMTVSSVRFSYRFTKTLSLSCTELCIDYELENLSPYEFKYIWSPHPLFTAMPKTKICLPEGVGLRAYDSHQSVPGRQIRQVGWPHAKQPDGSIVDISVLKPAHAKTAAKYFTTQLKEGWCGLQYPDGHALKILFPAEKIPYLGLWINEGGWPSSDPSYNIAMEPCTGCPDELETAIQNGEYASIGNRQKKQWHLILSIRP